MSVAIRVILVVDDQPEILILVKFGLQLKVDWTILTASSGSEGLLQAKTKHPDVILSDIDMPGMNGIDMLLMLQENDPAKHIPVILFTGRSEQITKKQSAHLGVKTIIPKPFDPLTLADQIMQAVS